MSEENIFECEDNFKIVERKYYNVGQNEWIWLPYAAHLCVSESCLFRMATVVGDFIVSTVGDYYKHGSQHKLEVGHGRFYETMVFRAKINHGEYFGCCPYVISGEEREVHTYNDAACARIGHMEMCRKYSWLKVVNNVC